MKPLDISERAEEVYFQRLCELELARLNMWVALWEGADRMQRADI